jgi:hypothetical protein
MFLDMDMKSSQISQKIIDLTMDWIISMFVLINGTIMENTLMEKEI